MKINKKGFPNVNLVVFIGPSVFLLYAGLLNMFRDGRYLEKDQSRLWRFVPFFLKSLLGYP